MNINIVVQEGQIYNLKAVEVHRGQDKIRLIKADMVQPSRQQGRMIPKFMRIPVEFWECKLAERLQEGDKIVGNGEWKMYEVVKDGIRKKRYAFDIHMFTWTNHSKAVCGELIEPQVEMLGNTGEMPEKEAL